MGGARVITSLANLMAGYTVTCPAEDPAFPALNLMTPQSVFLPARTTIATSTHWQIDRGASGAVMGILSIHRTNFLTANLLGSNDVNFGTILYTQAFPIARSAGNGRYNSEIIPGTSFTYRYARISVGTQTPVAESMNAAEGVFLLGGVWIGDVVYLPKNFLWDVEYKPLYPRVSLEASHGGHEQVLIKGNQRVILSGSRIAKTTKATPLSGGDELSRYMDYDRRCFEAEFFLLYLNTGAPAEVFVVRNGGDSNPWKMVRHKVAESPFELKELMGS